MDVQSGNQLTQKKCVPCEGGVMIVPVDVVNAQLAQLPGWYLTHAGERIRKDWRMKDFLAAMKFLEAVGQIAEEDQHHPDLHLESYRNVWIETYTHAIGGLSENDFILAAKIDTLTPAGKCTSPTS